MKNYLFIIAILFSLSAKSQLKVGDLNLSILSANAPIESVYQHEQCTFSGDLDYMILRGNNIVSTPFFISAYGISPIIYNINTSGNSGLNSPEGISILGYYQAFYVDKYLKIINYIYIKNNIPLRQNKDFATIEAATAYLKTLGRPRAAR